MFYHTNMIIYILLFFKLFEIIHTYLKCNFWRMKLYLLFLITNLTIIIPMKKMNIRPTTGINMIVENTFFYHFSVLYNALKRCIPNSFILIFLKEVLIRKQFLTI